MKTKYIDLQLSVLEKSLETFSVTKTCGLSAGPHNLSSANQKPFPQGVDHALPILTVQTRVLQLGPNLNHFLGFPRMDQN